MDYASGVIPNTNGKINMLFKKGDSIEGELTEKFIFNRQTIGVYHKPTVEGAYIETPDGKAFLPIEYLAPAIPEKTAQEKQSEIKPQTNHAKTYVAIAIFAVVFIAAFNYYKNE